MSATLGADVVVIGAGCAGMAAAVRLADARRRVVVVEAAPRLGGRATAFVDRETGDRVDNGQHVLFGCYRETYALLTRLGAATGAPLQARLALPMTGADGRIHTLRCAGLPPPWHLVGGLLRWSALAWRDRASAMRLAGFLRAVRRKGAPAVASAVEPTQTVTDWLRAHGQTSRLDAWLWRPLTLAGLNQSPDTAAAAPFVRILGELFGPRVEDSAIGIPAVPLDELLAEPASRLVIARGGRVIRSAPASIVVDGTGQIAGVRVGDELVTARTIVSAVPWHAFERLWDPGVPAPLRVIAGDAARVVSSSIVTTHLWFDRRVLDVPLVGFVGTTTQWAFAGERDRSGAPFRVTTVTSDAGDLVSAENDAIRDLAVADLRRAVPASRAATLVRALVVRERRATFSLAPSGPPRPGTRTPMPGFWLAGDWTDTGLPATIEGAVLSGHRAADAILKG